MKRPPEERCDVVGCPEQNRIGVHCLYHAARLGDEEERRWAQEKIAALNRNDELWRLARIAGK
jgi:hypothetical protein